MARTAPTRREVMALGATALAVCALGDRRAVAGLGVDPGLGSGSGGLPHAEVPWATGGTASMSGEYPDPFAARRAAAVCALTPAMMRGPCHGEADERRDLSEGQAGLPVRLALRVVDERCQPVPGVVVDIWHAGPDGLYSGADVPEMCTRGDARMIAGRAFRGRQVTNADGRVDFDTCFPGWYPGRAVHIHFQVRAGASEGRGEHVTSQLFFDDALNADIYTKHPDYADRGPPDTKNAEDFLLGGEDPAIYTLSAARQEDGALLAWKTIGVRRG